MKFKFFVLFMFAAGAAVAYAYEPLVILKKDSVTVTKDKIYLGDVADFSGVESDDADDLSTIYIKRAALPGYSVTVTKENVENQVKREFRYMKFSGPEKVTVYTGKTDISGGSLVETAEKYITDNMPWNRDDVVITAKTGRDSTSVIKGNVLLKVKEDNKIDFKGNVLVPVEIIVDGRFYKLEPVSLLVKVNAECLVASEDIRARQPLDGRARVEKKDVTYFPGNVLTDISKISGMLAKRSIMKGSVLSADMFESAPLFRRGGMVSVVARIRGVSVETTGTAFSEGREGETVKVKLINGKMLEGKVSPDGKVIIER
jgi:flagella basal body P-ring formation protein FlgA